MNRVYISVGKADIFVTGLKEVLFLSIVRISDGIYLLYLLQSTKNNYNCVVKPNK